MLVAALIVVCVIAVFYFLIKRRRDRFNAEATARLRARARKRWSRWLDDDRPEQAHDETWVEYQERKRR